MILLCSFTSEWAFKIGLVRLESAIVPAKLTVAIAKPIVAAATVMQSWCRCHDAKLLSLTLRCETRAVAATSCKVGGAAAISTVTIGRDRIAGIAAPNRVGIYNSDPTQSNTTAIFKDCVGSPL